MITVDQLLTLADAFQKVEGLSDTTLSWRLFGDSKKLAALRAGADLQSRRLAKAAQWFAGRWPSAAEWPAGIDRAKLSPSNQTVEA